MNAQDVYRIRKVNFNGNKTLNSKDLMAKMNTHPKKGLEKVLVWKKPPEFSELSLQKDLKALKTMYYRNGYLNPEITYKIDTVNFLFRKLMDITINIDENTPVYFDSVNYNIIGDSTYNDIVELVKPQLAVVKHTRFVDEHVYQDQKALKNKFMDEGYPFTRINFDIDYTKGRDSSNIIFNIDPGKKTYFGNIEIMGDSFISKSFIKKHVSIIPDSLFQQKEMNKTQTDLYETELFRYVVVRAIKDSVKNGKVPVRILVNELPRWSLETGVGYGTEDRLRLSAKIQKVNFLGGSRRLVFKTKTSYFVPYSFEFRFLQPDFIKTGLDFVFNPFYTRERERSYQVDRLGGSLNVIYNMSKQLDVNLGYSFERDALEAYGELKLDPDELLHNKSVFSLGANFNSTNNVFYPSKGYQFSTNLSYAGIAVGDLQNYYKISIEAARYFSVFNASVIALKIRSGIIQSVTRHDKTPIEERFQIGGANSLRGWSRNEISPNNQDGLPIGGNTMFETGIEYRFPVYHIFSGVVFADVGQVWQNSYEYSLSDLHYNTGLGVRVKTPIGPIRFDFATPIVNDPYAFQFFVSVGHAF